MKSHKANEFYVKKSRGYYMVIDGYDMSMASLETTEEAANKTAKEEADKLLAQERKSNAIKLELIGKVHNPDVVMNMLKMDDIIMDDNGKVKSGLKEALKGLQQTDSYLFIPEGDDGNKGNNQSGANAYVKGASPKDGDSSQPTNLSKAELFAKNLAKGHNEAVKAAADSNYFGE